MTTILPFGGRIKSASIGLDHLYADITEVDTTIKELRQDPPKEFCAAFFPRTGKDLKQALRGVGFFRPSLKTDQGMPGNFFPFSIDLNRQTSDLSRRVVAREEGLAIPEGWFRDRNGLTERVQTSFRK